MQQLLGPACACEYTPVLPGHAHLGLGWRDQDRPSWEHKLLRGVGERGRTWGTAGVLSGGASSHKPQPSPWSPQVTLHTGNLGQAGGREA